MRGASISAARNRASASTVSVPTPPLDLGMSTSKSIHDTIRQNIDLAKHICGMDFEFHPLCRTECYPAKDFATLLHLYAVEI